MLDPKAADANRHADTMRDNENEAVAEINTGANSPKKDNLHLSRRDMVFQLFNIITAGETVDLVK